MESGRSSQFRRLMRRFSIAALTAVLVAFLPATAGADHSGGSYKMPALARWDKSHLTVVIVPPTHGQLYNDDTEVLNGGDPNEVGPFNSYLKAVEAAIEEWRNGIATFGSRALQKNVKFDVYVLGRDDVPQDVLTNPDIVVTNDTGNPTVLGVSVQTPAACIANTSKFQFMSFSYADLFNVAAHEFGHCLGLMHIGEPESPWEEHPEHEMMMAEYQDVPGHAGVHLHCVSNLNVLGLEFVFSNLTSGSAGALAIEDRKVVTVPEDDYRTTCLGRDGGTTAWETPQDGGQMVRGPYITRMFITVDGRVSEVEVALRSKQGSQCSWWDRDTDTMVDGPCNEPQWVRAGWFPSPATEDPRWQTVLPQTLPAGEYQAYSRAIDTPAEYEEEGFEKGRNLITFTLL